MFLKLITTVENYISIRMLRYIALILFIAMLALLSGCVQQKTPYQEYLESQSYSWGAIKTQEQAKDYRRMMDRKRCEVIRTLQCWLELD